MPCSRLLFKSFMAAFTLGMFCLSFSSTSKRSKGANGPTILEQYR
jgi:hypothetical protein